MSENNQIKRIEAMELNLELSKRVVKELGNALEKYEAAQDIYYELANYYGSVQWMNDYEADEEGNLPENLKRSVLSEDEVYDLITEHTELMIRLQKAVLRSMEE
ncbi:MAG: DUF4298 domain-containing protein [Mogibacterium sp.]|nr:DUF4298 domain-containing protein [Mogibacterium sp.]